MSLEMGEVRLYSARTGKILCEKKKSDEGIV